MLPRLRKVSSIVMLTTWCRMADSTTSWMAPPIAVKASSGAVKSKFAAAFPGIGNAPDGEARDLDSLILSRDLVSFKLDSPCRGGNDRIAINPWQLEEADAAPELAYLSHSLVNYKLSQHCLIERSWIVL